MEKKLHSLSPTCSPDKIRPKFKGHQRFFQVPQEVLQAATHHMDVYDVGLKCKELLNNSCKSKLHLFFQSQKHKHVLFI